MDCLCGHCRRRSIRDNAHYEMLLKMASLRGEAARFAATPGAFNVAKQYAKEFEEYERALMICLRGKKWVEFPEWKK